MTATALGLTFPQSPLSTADEAIGQALRNAAIYGSEMTLWVE